MSLSAVGTNRNYVNCCDDIRPFIATVDSTTIFSVGNGNNVDGGTITGSINVTDLVVDTLTANTINSTTGNYTTLNVTNQLTTSFISAFSVQSGNNVQFFGITTEDRLFWNSNQSTLYIDGQFKTRDCFITLNEDSSEVDLGPTQADRDNGVLFNWYDSTAMEEKTGFFGFKYDNQRFVFNTNVSYINGECNVTGINEELGDIDVRTLYAKNIVNDDIGQNLAITSIDDINISADNVNISSLDDVNIETNGAGNVNLSSVNGDMNLAVSGGVLSMDVQNGSLDILVNGGVTETLTIENTRGVIDILTETTSAEAIRLQTQNGGILIENESSDFNIVLKSDTNILLSTTGTTVGTFNEDGFQVNKEKDDYLKWIPFYQFDAESGIWESIRSTPSNPLHFWRRDPENGTSRIYVDVDLSSRTTTDKGYRLQSIYFSYNITVNSITSITPTFTIKSFNPSIPSNGPTLTNVAFTNVNLTAGTTVSEHYRSVNITTPFFLNTESTFNIELEVVTPATSVFDFYGVHLYFDRNDL